MIENRLKRELVAGGSAVGTWVHTFAAPQLPPVLAAAGLDYVIVDMEHSAFSIREVADLSAAAIAAGITPVVRPPAHERASVGRLLDQGALGVYVPHVESAEEAAALVRLAKFPPEGERGSQPPSVTTAFASVDAAHYAPAANRETMVIVQIESAAAVGRLDEILSVPGVDGAVIGRGDLAFDLGVSGQRGHPEIDAAVMELIAACERHDRIPGLMVLSVEDGEAWRERGIRMISYASEVIMLREAARSAVLRLKGAKER